MTSPRLAFFTPLQPKRNGVSDYSEELLPFLGNLVEVDVVVGPYEPSNSKIMRQFRVIHAEEFLADPSRFGLPVYQISNHLHHHEYMIPCMRRVPGITVLHDCCLHYLVLGLTLMRGDFDALRDTLRPSYRGASGRMARRLLFSKGNPYEISFAGPFATLSRGIIVHSEHARQLVSRQAPDRKIRVIPMGIPEEECAPSAPGLRVRHGLDEKDFVVASATTMAYNKRLDLILRACAELDKAGLEFRLLIIGSGPIGAQARKLIAHLGLKRRIVRTGWVSGNDYRELIRASDVIVDLRFPSGAETSASLARAMAGGKPLIVSGQGPFLELPDECTVKIPVDGNEVANLTESILSLARNTARLRRMGCAARNYVLDNLRLEQAAEMYVDFAREVIESPLPPIRESPALFGDINSKYRKLLLATTYKLFRTAFLFRKYGWSDTLDRVVKELALQRGGNLQ